VTEIGITYLRLETVEGVLHLPNSQVLGSVVGLVRPAAGQPAGPPAPGSPSGAPQAGPAVPPAPAS